MNETEKSVVVQPNIFIINNVEYILESEFGISPRLEDVFTPNELRCGRQTENSNDIINLSRNDDISKRVEILEVSTNNLDIRRNYTPTFEINDSDEDVVFVAEYSRDNGEQNIREVSQYEIPFSLGGEASPRSTSSNTSAEAVAPNEPRRNPRRSVRNNKYKNKCSEYVTEEDLNELMTSDEEDENIEGIEEALSKEIRPKTLIVKSWPAEGLHERPEYNEKTGEIEKFDCTIRQIEKKNRKVVVEKPKILRIQQKKKSTIKKSNFRRGKKKKGPEKKVIEMVAFDNLGELINETYYQLSEVFIKTFNESRHNDFHICHSLSEDENDENNLQNSLAHDKCLVNLSELLINQSQLYHLGCENSNFFHVFNSLRSKVEEFNRNLSITVPEISSK